MKRQLLNITLLGLIAFALHPPFIHATEPVPPDLEERMQRLEKELESLRNENQQLKQDLGIDGKTSGLVSAKPSGKEPVLKLGGLLQAQSDLGDRGDRRFSSENDRFYLRRARVKASGLFLEEFDFRIELDLFGTLGETTGLRAQMTDGYITWNKWEEANLRFGQFKTPFGYEQLAADPKLFTIERSLANDRLTLNRQIGAQVSGNFLEKRIGYATGVFNGNSANNNFNDNEEFLFAGRISGTPWEGQWLKQEAKWTVGTNGYFSDDAGIGSMGAEFGFDSVPGGTADNIFSGNRLGAGIDTQLHLGPFDLWAEYLTTRFKPTDNLPQDEFEADGWYVQGSYFIVLKRLQGVVKYESFDPDTEVDGNTVDTLTIGLNYYIKGDDIKVQLNYLLTDAGVNSGFVFDNQNKILLRLQLIF
jgi:phosphate-selective porin